MKWRKFSEEKPLTMSELVVATTEGVQLGLFEWFPDFKDWPEHVKPLTRICGKCVEEPIYWMYYEEFKKEIMPQ